MPDSSSDNSTATWETALFTYEGMPLALRVRPAADSAENRVAYPHLVIVAHELAQVKSNGLPSDEYNQSLFQFDLDLQDAVAGADEGIVFLIETIAGSRNYYGCIADPVEVQSRVNRIRTSYPNHVLNVSVGPDKAWEFYNEYRTQFPW